MMGVFVTIYLLLKHFYLQSIVANICPTHACYHANKITSLNL